jgi:methionyl-tRNA synthetase
MVRHFVTSALPYVNNVPHLGNIIGSTLSADVYCRYLRSRGANVFYLCGTDEYGTTTEIKAAQEGLTCEEICTKYNAIHSKVYDWFNIKFDEFGRTTTATQTHLTHDIFLSLWDADLIESKTITQLYCTKCDIYLADRYVKGICYHPKCVGLTSICSGDQCDVCGNLIDMMKIIRPWCLQCHTLPIARDSEHLYLKLGSIQGILEKWLPTVKLTHNASQITRAWLDRGLESRCITRDLKWGTPVPWDAREGLLKFKGKVFYVWFDAPIGYFSIAKSAGYDLALTKEDSFVQFMAKDNVPFHTILFPASIISSNKYPLVTQISATEYLQFEGGKFSKSNNTGLFGDQVIKISQELKINEDYWRYYLIAHRPEIRDSDFTWKDFANTINADLINNFGNFVNRVYSMIRKNFSGSFQFEVQQDDIHALQIKLTLEKYHQYFDGIELRTALEQPMLLSGYGNKILHEFQPWKIPENAQYSLGISVLIILDVANMLKPFLPRSATYIYEYVKINCDNAKYTVQLKEESYMMPFHTIDPSSLPKSN